MPSSHTHDQPTSTPLDGHVVLVTGNVDGLTREAAKEAIVRLGGIAAPGVTGKVTLLVPGEGAGVSKMSKAKTLDIPILAPEQFADLALGEGPWVPATGRPYSEWETATQPAPEPRPVIDLTHSVAKAVVHVPGPTGGLQREVRLWCSCGHKRVREALYGTDACPRPDTPTTAAPWSQPVTSRP